MEQTLCICNRPLCNKNKGKERKLKSKPVTMIGTVTGRLEITQYDNKIEVSIVNLVKTMWLTRYPRQMEITYDQGS